MVLEHFFFKSFGRPKNGGKKVKMKQNQFLFLLLGLSTLRAPTKGASDIDLWELISDGLQQTAIKMQKAIRGG